MKGNDYADTIRSLGDANLKELKNVLCIKCKCKSNKRLH